MVKVLHWCALRISDFAIWLHEKGGNLELWCDERTYRRKWTSFGMAYDVPVAWLEIPKFDPADFKMPTPSDDWDEYLKCVEAVRPRPITMLDEGDA